MATCSANSPLNSILGETTERVLPDGTRYMSEQISHHPPILAYTLTDPNGDYEFNGYHETKAGLVGANTANGHAPGVRTITFPKLG